MLQHINFAVLEHCPDNYMKPLSPNSRQPSRSEENSLAGTRSTHPLSDYSFRAAASELKANGVGARDKVARPIFAPGFRKLSNEFLGAETTRSYLAEALFFAIIVGVSVWPIVSMMQALGQLTK